MAEGRWRLLLKLVLNLFKTFLYLVLPSVGMSIKRLISMDFIFIKKLSFLLYHDTKLQHFSVLAVGLGPCWWSL